MQFRVTNRVIGPISMSENLLSSFQLNLKFLQDQLQGRSCISSMKLNISSLFLDAEGREPTVVSNIPERQHVQMTDNS